jgi:hypothetical protein
MLNRNSQVAASDVEQQSTELTLADRLDPAIGEASTGIGLMVAELVRRSLRGGVANIDGHLQQFAEERVEAAISEKMPEVVEAADQIAASTSQKIADAAVLAITTKTEAAVRDVAQQAQAAEQKLATAITEAETRAVTQSRTVLDETVGRLKAETHESVVRVQAEAREVEARLAAELTAARGQTDDTVKRLEEIHEKGKESWKRVQQELLSLGEKGKSLEQTFSEGQTLLRRMESDASRAQALWRQQLEATRSELQEQVRVLISENGVLRARLDEIERPKGIKAFFQRFRKKKSDATATGPGLPDLDGEFEEDDEA